MFNQNFIIRLLERYNLDQSSESKEKVLDGFLNDLYKKSVWDEKELGNKKETKKIIFDSINSKINRSRPNYGWIKFVSVAVILILFKLCFPSENTTKQITFVTTQTIDSIILPDNSRIILSPHSKVAYDSDFNDKYRAVSLLEGNAFFKVTKNILKPFTVTTGNIKTTVLGTSFNIDIQKDKINVDVKSGRVQVASQSQHKIIYPNQGVSYTINKQSLSKEKDIRVLPWYEKDIQLSEIKIKELGIIVKNRFGYNIRYNDRSIDDEKVTIHLSKSDSIIQIIDKLKYITSLKFKINANEIIVAK
ncbi:FecR family protein [Flavobacterium sp. DSR3-2]|uniref:FecR family protein n=1 Tax=Flavobacterium sp. DSR3-2 TaxID=2804634 RepID=UPI003CF3615E